jgi:hypothetical protein
MFAHSWLPAGLFAVIPLSAACSIELSPATVVGDTAVTGTIKVLTPAPSAGLVIALSSSNPNARVLPQVTVPPGQSIAAFTISTSPVSTSTRAVITAANADCSAAAGITVHPAVLAGLLLSDTTSVGNADLSGAVTLNGPAPSTGAVVKLQSTDVLVTVPAYVTIPAGQTSASFALATGQSLSRNSVAVTATYGASVQTALLNVLPGI